jgi:nitrite reductase/ring-hydroxylating ferredoxin subunit
MSFGADWYSIALSEGLEAGTSAGTRLFDREIVVWRDSAGVAHAWEDRCPHRGMRLSFGFVRGDRIACLYHGWQYDGDGQCRYIPAHPDLQVPSTIRTTAYPCRERLGMVWIYSDLAREAPPDPPPERAPITAVRSIYFECGPDDLLEGLGNGELAPFPSSAANSRPAIERSGSLVSLRLADTELVAGVQPVGASRSALHLVVCGRDVEWRGDGQKRVARWAEELRRGLPHRSAARAP